MVGCLWWPGGFVLLGPTGLRQSEAVPGRPPPAGQCRQQAEAHGQPFCKRGYLLVLELQPEGQASGLPQTQERREPPTGSMRQ